MGKVLFEQVCRQLSLLEADYFGLEYQEQGSNTKVKKHFFLTRDYKLMTIKTKYVVCRTVLVGSGEAAESTGRSVVGRTSFTVLRKILCVRSGTTGRRIHQVLLFFM